MDSPEVQAFVNGHGKSGAGKQQAPIGRVLHRAMVSIALAGPLAVHEPQLRRMAEAQRLQAGRERQKKDALSQMHRGIQYEEARSCCCVL